MANKLYNKQVSPKGYQTGGRVAKMGGGMMMNRPMMNGSRTNMKIGGFLKKVGKKVGKAAAGVGAAVLAAKALKKKKPKGKKMDAVDKFFKKKGTTLKTGSAIAAETMAKADRDKKKFRKGLDKIAAAGGVSKLKAGGSALKPVNPETQKGLSKLPTKVRNKMGFMKKGGRVGLKEGSKGETFKKPKNPIKMGPMKVKRPETKFSPELKKKIEKSMLKMQSEKLRRKVR